MHWQGLGALHEANRAGMIALRKAKATAPSRATIAELKQARWEKQSGLWKQ